MTAVSAAPAVDPAAPPAPQDLLKVLDLKVQFPVKEGSPLRRRTLALRAVDGVTFNIRKGETLGLVGESGSGKSTTGRAVLRIVKATSGSIRFDGQELTTMGGEQLRRMRRRMQLVFQDPFSSLDPRMNIADIVEEPLEVHGLGDPAARRERVADLLAVVGLDPRQAMRRYPHEFSGGQRQRIGLARALASNPEFIVADEPVSALDVSIQAQIINLLMDLQAKFQLTYLFIAHDLSIVRHISDRVAVMYLGAIVEMSDRTDLYEHPLHPYTVALLSAVPIPDPLVEQKRQRVILSGELPSPLNMPSGCRFRNRCWLYEHLGRPDRCAEDDPSLRPMSAGHRVACHFSEQMPGAG